MAVYPERKMGTFPFRCFEAGAEQSSAHSHESRAQALQSLRSVPAPEPGPACLVTLEPLGTRAGPEATRSTSATLRPLVPGQRAQDRQAPRGKARATAR